jgi:hypothetical protein
MRKRLIVNLLMLTPLASSVVGAQIAGTDPRLSDPAFIKVRDEARVAARCADRANPVPVSAPPPRNTRTR